VRRLFLKLFLSYWTALVLFAAAVTVAAAVYLDQTRARHDTAPRFGHAESIRTAAQAAAASSGLAGLSEWARSVDADELVPVLVLDRDGHDLLNREVSQRALAHLSRHMLDRGGEAPEWRAPIRVGGGQEFWLVPDPHAATLLRLVTRPKVVTVPLILAALVGGVVCFALARYLASPLARLRAATHAYAAGDFTRRVGPTLGGRRDEIAELAQALDNMAERIGTLVESQRTLLRDISHELRSPLARVQAAVGLARQRTGTLAAPELDRIEHETERLGALIGQVLSLSRLESGVQPRRHWLELDGLILEVLKDTAIEAQTAGCALRFATRMPCLVLGDAMLLQSALENVVRNAVRHAPAGSEVAVHLLEDPATEDCIVRVSDRGPGVPDDMLAQIFEPFVRVDAARGPNSGGVGLGLAIARRAVVAHGGSIEAANRKEGGLEVTIRLPKTARTQAVAESDPATEMR
jgi:two-component system sensor histidine kinase CpxA